MKKLLALVVLTAVMLGVVGTCFASVPGVASAGTPGIERPVSGILPIIPPPPPPPPPKVGSGDRTSGILPIIPPPPPPPPSK